MAARAHRNDAQECFCGEPNCVGTIGGKTQTDIGGMDDLFLDGESGRCKASGRFAYMRLTVSISPYPHRSAWYC